MPDLLLRVEFRNHEQARAAMKGQMLPWLDQQLKAGREIVGEFTLREDAITTEQRSYFHAVVLEDIALYARPNGEQYPARVWKAYLKDKFLGMKRVSYLNPLTGKKSRRTVRKSTEDLGVRGYANFIDQVIAFAATDLGVTVSAPLPPHLRGLSRSKPKTAAQLADPDTGEIIEEAQAA